MKRGVISRYERTADGRVIIDVAAERIEDLYNDFDKHAPYIRRDLDQDLVDYLIGCARELAREPFLIRFTLNQPGDETRLSRVRHSVNGYFEYLAEGERHKILRMFRRSAVLFCIGLGILFASVSTHRMLGETRSVMTNVCAEGLTVAAWVALWEALAIFLIEWFPHRRNIQIYQRLAQAELTFETTPET